MPKRNLIDGFVLPYGKQMDFFQNYFFEMTPLIDLLKSTTWYRLHVHCTGVFSKISLTYTISITKLLEEKVSFKWNCFGFQNLCINVYEIL